MRLSLYTTLLCPISYGVWHRNGGSEEGSNIAQWYCNSIATVWAMQVEGGKKRMIDSCTKALK